MVGKIFWLGGSGCGCIMHYFGWVGFGGKICRVGGGGCENILG